MLKGTTSPEGENIENVSELSRHCPAPINTTTHATKHAMQTQTPPVAVPTIQLNIKRPTQQNTPCKLKATTGQPAPTIANKTHTVYICMAHLHYASNHRTDFSRHQRDRPLEDRPDAACNEPFLPGRKLLRSSSRRTPTHLLPHSQTPHHNDTLVLRIEEALHIQRHSPPRRTSSRAASCPDNGIYAKRFDGVKIY